jgi:hypothetical protein
MRKIILVKPNKKNLRVSNSTRERVKEKQKEKEKERE